MFDETAPAKAVSYGRKHSDFSFGHGHHRDHNGRLWRMVAGVAAAPHWPRPLGALRPARPAAARSSGRRCSLPASELPRFQPIHRPLLPKVRPSNPDQQPVSDVLLTPHLHACGVPVQMLRVCKLNDGSRVGRQAFLVIPHHARPFQKLIHADSAGKARCGVCRQAVAGAGQVIAGGHR